MAPFVAELLAKIALRVDEDSERRLALAMQRAFVEATALLERRGQVLARLLHQRTRKSHDSRWVYVRNCSERFMNRSFSQRWKTNR